jgi:hypothetical protein
MDGHKLGWCNACLLIVISICFFMIYFFHRFYLIMLHFVYKSRVFYCYILNPNQIIEYMARVLGPEKHSFLISDSKFLT